jgi:hypothetical protein
MTAWEKAHSIVENCCPQGSPINRKALREAIRWAIVQADLERRQPKELTPAQAGSMAYQILYFVDEWTRVFHECAYPTQANRLAACRASIIAIARGEERTLREVPKKRVKGAHA